MTNYLDINWDTLPKPQKDANLDHLINLNVPSIPLVSNNQQIIDISHLKGTIVLFIYPMTGHPHRPLPPNWNQIPGARGCTPQVCSFKNNYELIKKLGVSFLFGLSSQSNQDQQQFAQRINIPFKILSDENLKFGNALNLPFFQIEGKKMLKRITLIIDSGKIVKYFYPIFPPDQNVTEVISWLQQKMQ